MHPGPSQQLRAMIDPASCPAPWMCEWLENGQQQFYTSASRIDI